MRVKHRERKDDDNDIIFQCGWYRGILRDFAPEKHLLFRGFLYVCEKSERKDFIFQKKFPSRTLSYQKECTEYGIHDRRKQKGNLRDQ